MGGVVENLKNYLATTTMNYDIRYTQQQKCKHSGE